MAGSKELNKYLNELSKEELIKEVYKLYKKFKPVRSYYVSELGIDNGESLRKYKLRLEKLFIAKFNFSNPNLNEANAIVKEFVSISVHALDHIDLMLYKVELCLEFLKEWGFEFDNIARSVANTYPEVLNKIYDNRLEKTFQARCKKLEGVALDYDLISDTLIIDEEDEDSDS